MPKPLLTSGADHAPRLWLTILVRRVMNAAMEMVHFIPPGQRRLANLAAQAEGAPVLISGGSGTGKGAIARWIHLNGPRAGKPFVVANLKKTFSEQVALAPGGTLLIPEIGEWGLAEQRMIFSFLKTRSVATSQAEGDSLRILLNVRLIATTDQNLSKRAQAGMFNAELYEKLSLFRLEMPPLTERADEFVDIATGIAAEIARELRKDYVRGISEAAIARLQSYNWPGNLRELRNVLRLAVIAADGGRIEAENLPEFGSERINFRATREQFEKVYLTELLRTYGGKLDEASKMSRMDRATFQAKIKQYGLEAELNSR